jgi:hypothetical protein
MKDIWWSKEHYLMSRYFANKEFQMIKRVFPNVMFKQSLQMFYLDEETNRIKTFSLDEGIVMIPRNKVKHVFIEKDGNDPRIRQSNTNGGRQMKLFFSLR